MPENKKKTRGNLAVMGRLVGLVKPLAPVMVAAVLLGVAGFLCAIFITVLGAYALLDSILPGMPISLGTVCLLLPVLAIARGVLHYAEQGCNHFIAFKLLAISGKISRRSNESASCCTRLRFKGRSSRGI